MENIAPQTGLSNQKDQATLYIHSTSNYGYMYPDSTSFDDQDYFEDRIMNYKLFKVRIWYGTIDNVQCVTGFQTFYKERSTNKEVSPGEYRLIGFAHEGVETITLQGNEYFSDFNVAINMKVASIELKTSTGVSKRVGGTSGEIKKTPLAQKNNVIVATFGNYTDCLTCMGVYYMNKLSYFKALYSGYFYLRHAFRKEEFKNAILKKIDSFNKENKAIVKACLMDDITFLYVMRYTFAG